MEAPVIGIDLGTTYSCVGVYQNEKPHIIDIKDGNETSKTMASVVSYTKNGRIIGNTVKENFRLDPTATIYGVKRFIGRRYNEITDLMQHYPVTVVNDNNNPKFQIEFKQDEHLLTPEEVSAAILEKLKTSAEDYLGMEVTKAVITVPANFNDSQRQATINAGRIAGLDVLRIVNEPTAASFAYGIHDKYRDTNEPCNLLVYDFGGGTFDISIINITDCVYEVKATNGDTLLGGDDIDQLILDYFTNLFQSKYEKHLAQDRRAMRRLRLQCEKLKRELSYLKRANISLDSLHEGIDFESELTRTEFETFCKPLFERTLHLLEETLKQAQLNKSDIDEIILVGGTTRIPKIRQMVAAFFDGKELNMSLNPDETVALGAAVQAAILDTNTNNTNVIGSLLLIDVNSLSLGVELIGGRMDIIIPRNTQIPVEITKTFVTTRDNQESVKVSVYEGEHLKVSENTLLGAFLFEGITPAARGQTQISLSYLINTDGILKITAVELTKNVSKSLDLVMDKYRLSDDEINQLIARSQELKEEEKEWADRIQASLEVRNYCTDTIKMVEEIGKQMKNEQREIVLIKCNEILKWLEKNEDELKSVYEDIKKEVFYICNPIMKRYL